MKFSLLDAQVFVDAHTYGSLKDAAAHNNVVTSAVSTRLRRLEEQFGLSLFERTGRGIRPTPAGDLFAERCRLVLDQARRTETVMAELAHGEKGRIRMFTNSNILHEVLPQVLGPFLAANPELEIDLQDRPSLETVPALLEGRVHLGIVSTETDREQLDCVPILHEVLVAVCPPDQAPVQDGQGRTSYGALLRMPLIGLPTRSAFTQSMQRRAHELGMAAEFRLHLDDFGAICLAVAGGAGCALVPESAARRFVAMGYVTLPLSDGWAERDLYLAARDRKSLPGFARALFDHLAAGHEAPTPAV